VIRGRVRWVTTALSVSAFVILSTACSSSAAHGATTAPVSAPQSTAAATPTVVPTPSAMPFVSSADEAGAKAFVFAYYAELNRAFATGDTSELAVYHLVSCSCTDFDDEIRAAYEAGGSISGAKLAITKWAYGDHGPAFAKTAIEFTVPAITTRVPGKQDVVAHASRAIHVLDLRRVGSRWVISTIRYKEVSAS
jgi:hypothetical protein